MLLGKHRELKPTGIERCIWGEGDSSTLLVVETPFGVMGVLYLLGELYVGLPVPPCISKALRCNIAPTADSHEEWQVFMRYIALEGRCFVIGCNQHVTKSMYPTDFYYSYELAGLPENISHGGNCVVDPFGRYVVGPIWDHEEMFYADLDLDQIVLSRMDFDPTGHYSRPDVFTLMIRTWLYWERPSFFVRGPDWRADAREIGIYR